MDKKVLVFTLILLVVLSAVALASNDIATAQEPNQDSFNKIDHNTEEGPATDSPWKLTPTKMIAGAAIAAIFFSWYATCAVQKAARGELIMQISNTHGSLEMLKAMMRLIWWVEEKEEDPREDWLETFRKLRKNRDRYSEIKQVDEDRRKVLNYYEAIDTIKKYHLLSKKIVKSLHIEHQELLYKRVVRPLTNQIEPKVTKEWPELTVNYPEGYLVKQKLRDIEQKKINDQKRK